MRSDKAELGFRRAPSAPLDRGAVLLGLITVVLANVRYLAGLRTLLDPLVSMEPFYIKMAQQPAVGILRESPAWGPLYALWLKPFVSLLGDPLTVYAADVWALSVALSVALYLHVAALTRTVTPAIAVALLFLISEANVPLAGKVSDFALLVLLVGWTLGAMVADGARRTSLWAITALIASYARPELWPAVLGLCALALWQIRQSENDHRRHISWPIAALALTAALALGVGIPIHGSGDDDRLLDAFREHFAWNWGNWHGQWRYFQAVWDGEFGNADSVTAALLVNPGAILHHVAANVFGTARFIILEAYRHVPILAPAGNTLGVSLESAAVALAVYATLALVIVRSALRRQVWARHGSALLGYAVVALPCLSAAVIIYPLQNYLVIPSMLAALAAALSAATIWPDPLPRGWLARIVAAAVCLALVPRPFVLPSSYAVAGPSNVASISVSRPVTDTIAVVRGLGLPPPVHVLTTTDGVGEMLGAGFEEVKMWQKGALPLADYLRARHVDVLVTLQLGHDNFVVDDPLWKRIETQPQEAGFRRIPVPGHDEVGVFVPVNGDP